jgi:hypothetical protein
MKLEELWHSKLPLKIKNFMWLVHRNRIQIADNLGRKKWKGSKMCQLFNTEESVDHLMFNCPIAVSMWAVIRDGLKLKYVPQSVRDFKENFLLIRGSKGMRVMWFLFRAVCWALWLNRNDYSFNNKIISSLML